MKKLLLFAGLALFCLGFTSCKDAETYADLVDNEKEYISNFIGNDPFGVNFGKIIAKDEDWVTETTKKVLTDSIHPEQAGVELHQWYKITEGDFKRLYFCINSWGEDGLNDKREAGETITNEEYKESLKNGKKFFTGKNALVRFDNMYLLNEFNYEEPSNNVKLDNLDPLSFQLIINWNAYYYTNSYYGYSYGSGSSYECTSGGVGFATRFLWEGANVSIICPFSLVETQYSSYYYTLYYGEIVYSKPNYIPQ